MSQTVPKKASSVQNDGFSKVSLKKDVYLPNNCRVDARIVQLRLFDSRKDAHKAISRVLQSKFRNNLTFLKYSLTQYIEILRIWFVDLFFKVNNEIV